MIDALAAYRCDVESLIAEGDQAGGSYDVLRHPPRILLGAPATGRRVTWAGTAFFSFGNGLVNDLWVLGDLHSLREQLNRPAEA